MFVISSVQLTNGITKIAVKLHRSNLPICCWSAHNPPIHQYNIFINIIMNILQSSSMMS